MSANLLKRVERAEAQTALLHKGESQNARAVKEIIAHFYALRNNKSAVLSDMSSLSDAELLRIIGTDTEGYPQVKRRFKEMYREARAQEKGAD